MGHLLWRGVLAVVGASVLSGCVDNLPDVRVGQLDTRSAITKNGSPRQATVALASLQGAPDPVAARFDRAFAKESAAREITIADPSTAHYLVRGYLSAAPSESSSGTDLTYVYDIFDANDQGRVDRVEDTLSVPGSGPDAWALVDDRAMASLAGRSADSLAQALAATPVARAALAPAATANAAAGPSTVN